MCLTIQLPRLYLQDSMRTSRSIIHLPIDFVSCSISCDLDRAMGFRSKRGRNTAELKSFKSTAEPPSSDEDRICIPGFGLINEDATWITSFRHNRDFQSDFTQRILSP